MNAFEIYLNGKQLVRANNTHERNYSYEIVDLEAGKFYPNVKTSKARPSNHLGKGVVPPSAKISASQKPNSKGLHREDDAPRITMKGRARIKAPYGITK